MFATLLGGLPRPPLDDDATVDSLVEAAVRAQEAAGLEPITDGGFHGQDDPVKAWVATQHLTDRAAKQPILGPYTAARSSDEHAPARTDARARTEATLARANTLNAILRELAAQGCPLVEIHEPAAISIGTDEAERALFREAHLRLLDGVDGPHLSLALTGGNADVAGIETILAAPYASLAVDLIAGPDNWRLVVATPGDRGIVCGAMSTEPGSDDGPEILMWAAGYAASTAGRGPDRVGIATASLLAHLPWDVAIRKLERLGEAVRIADLPPDKRVRAMDPRAVSIRSAALGHVDPPPPHAPDQTGEPPTE
jgi:methionine synthase II (cobalamin-independent)